MSAGSGSPGARPRCAVPGCRYFTFGGGSFCRSHDPHAHGGDGAGAEGSREGSRSKDQHSFLSHMGLVSNNVRGLLFDDLLRFNTNFQDLLGDRLRRWERGTPADRQPDVAAALPLLSAVFGGTQRLYVDFLLNDLSATVHAILCHEIQL